MKNFIFVLIFSNFALSWSDYIESAALNNDGCLALGYAQGTILIFDINKDEIVWKLKGADEIIGSLNFSNDNKMLVSTSGKEVKIWDINNSTLLSSWQIQSDFNLTGASFAPEDDALLLSASGLVRIYDLKGGELYKLPHEGTARAQFNRAGTKIAVSDFNSGRVLVYDVLSRLKVWSAQCYSPAAATFSPIGNTLAVASQLQVKLFNLDKSSNIYEFDHSEDFFHNYDNWFISVSYNQTGDKILAFDNKGCLFNINLATKSEDHLKNLGSINLSVFSDKNIIIVVTSRKILTVEPESMRIITEKVLGTDF